MRIVLFHSPHCRACEQFVGRWPALPIQRLDVCQHLERAAALGVSRPPALVVDGALIAEGAAVEAALLRLDAQEARS